MDDYKIIIYIVLAVLYFLFSGKKKTPQKNTPPVAQKKEETRKVEPVSSPKPILTPPKPVQSQPEPQPYSLEDILREFGQNLEGKVEDKSQEVKQVKPEVIEQPVGKIIDYDENIKEEIESLETGPAVDKSPKSPSKDEHFSPYSTDAEGKNKYAAMLKDPEGIKTAFIASEIFNRKY